MLSVCFFATVKRDVKAVSTIFARLTSGYYFFSVGRRGFKTYLFYLQKISACGKITPAETKRVPEKDLLAKIFWDKEEFGVKRSDNF